MNKSSWNLSRIDNSDIKMIAGVASGISYTFGIPTWMVRLAFILGAFLSGGAAILIYLALWLVLPKITVDSAIYNNRSLDLTPAESETVIVVDKDAHAYVHKSDEVGNLNQEVSDAKIKSETKD